MRTACRHPDRSQLVHFERGRRVPISILDTRRGVVSRFTDEADEDIFPLWARGQHIRYTSVQKGQVALVQRHIATRRTSVPVAPQTQEIFATDVTPDGRHLIYQRMDPESGFDIPGSTIDGRCRRVIILASQPRPTPLVQTSADERTACLSPDGRWMAFVSNTRACQRFTFSHFPDQVAACKSR